MLRIKVVKSFIGQKPTNKITLYSMGLRRVGASRDLPDNACTRGMIHKVKHMLVVEEVAEETPKKAAKTVKAAPVAEAPAAEAKPKAKRTTKKAEATEE